jgi:hypothetical protein
MAKFLKFHRIVTARGFSPRDSRASTSLRRHDPDQVHRVVGVQPASQPHRAPRCFVQNTPAACADKGISGPTKVRRKSLANLTSGAIFHYKCIASEEIPALLRHSN